MLSLQKSQGRQATIRNNLTGWFLRHLNQSYTQLQEAQRTITKNLPLDASTGDKHSVETLKKVIDLTDNLSSYKPAIVINARA